MNLIEHALKENLKQAVLKAFEIDTALEDIVIEVPRLKEHGDYSSNIAMRLSKTLKMNPKIIAQSIIDGLDKNSIENTEIAGAGFINLFLKKDVLTQVITTVLKEDELYGRLQQKVGKTKDEVKKMIADM